MSANRQKWSVLTVALVLMWLVAGCSSTAPAPAGPVTHTVLLWLRHPGSAADRARLTRGVQSLRIIPGVLRVETGRQIPVPAEATERDFDFGVAIIFRDRAALQRFKSDPQHRQAMARYLRPLVRRFAVYDSGIR